MSFINFKKADCLAFFVICMSASDDINIPHILKFLVRVNLFCSFGTHDVMTDKHYSKCDSHTRKMKLLDVKETMFLFFWYLIIF